MSVPDGGPAFPVVDERFYSLVSTLGMSLRDWFAGQALAGMLANVSTVVNDPRVTTWSYQHADAMLAERERVPRPLHDPQ